MTPGQAPVRMDDIPVILSFEEWVDINVNPVALLKEHIEPIEDET